MSYAPDEDVDEERIAEHEAERDLAPSDKVGELREIAELFWSFHNARLADPSINEMKPYIQPILDLVHQKQVEAIRICASMRGEWSGMDEDEFEEAAFQHLRKQT